MSAKINPFFLVSSSPSEQSYSFDETFLQSRALTIPAGKTSVEISGTGWFTAEEISANTTYSKTFNSSTKITVPAGAESVSLTGKAYVISPNGGWGTLASIGASRTYMLNHYDKDNKYIYTFGGTADVATTFMRYDIYSNTWTALPAPASGYRSTAGTLVVDSLGRIIVIGGRKGSPGSKAVDRFDLSTGSWTALADMQAVRFAHASLIDDNDVIYCFGGNNASVTLASGEKYNPLTNSWSATASMPMIKDYAATGTDEQGRFYLFGGRAVAGASTKTCYRYNPSTDTWDTLAEAPQAKFFSRAIYHNNKFYVFGGMTSYFSLSTAVATAEVYDIVSDTWSTLPSMNFLRTTFSAAKDKNDNIYAICGSNGTSLKTFEYRSVNDYSGTWTMSPSSAAYGHHLLGETSAFIDEDDHIFVISGNTPNCEVYSPTAYIIKSSVKVDAGEPYDFTSSSLLTEVVPLNYNSAQLDITASTNATVKVDYTLTQNSTIYTPTMSYVAIGSKKYSFPGTSVPENIETYTYEISLTGANEAVLNLTVTQGGEIRVRY